MLGCNLWLGLSLIVLAVATSAAASGKKPFVVPPADQILKTLKTSHPRLLADAAAFERVKRRTQADEQAKRWYAAIRADAVKILTQTPSKHEIPDGKRLLRTSRRVKDRIYTLAFVYRLDGDRRFLVRAWRELEAAAKFKDWNPSHFLDTAEMTHAFAIGCDWLYDAWSPEQRHTLREAIVRLGLEPAMKVYRGRRGWARNHNNWNQVCNGGIGTGALAIADEEPKLAAQVLGHALQSIPLAMRHYEPDGAGTEGPTYWDYGSRYNVLLLASLASALGTDFGLSDVGAFAASGAYPIHMAGASGLAFNFADCGERVVATPQHLWMGTRYARPDYTWHRYSRLAGPRGRGGVLDLLWLDEHVETFDPSALPLDRHFRVAECASMRSAWGDPKALVLGIQAGDNSNLGGHRHLDLGSFILEANGVRWAIDSGVDHETYMRHRNKHPRWAFYRVRAEGHNALVLNPANGPDQALRAKARIVRFESEPARALAVVDLTAAYAEHARRVRRTFAMFDRAAITITDEVEAKAPADLWWFMHTQADVEISKDAKAATLTQSGQEFSARIEAPGNARFTVMPAEPFPTSPKPKEQASNQGRRKLAIHLPDTRELTLTVRFDPASR